MNTNLLKSFAYASQGIKEGFQERNMKFHYLAALGVIVLGVYFRVSQTEWLDLILCIVAVISAELLNTALEHVCDAMKTLSPEMHRHMGKPKDLGAGAVLVVAVGTAAVGIIIFLPHFLELFRSLQTL